MRRKARPPALIVLMLVLWSLPAAAQDGAGVDTLIELVRTRPSGMDRDEWRDKRRDAARELGQRGDKRAVPVLIQVVETEQFDAIAEIAIEALGSLGDPSAVPALQNVVSDASRDRYVRKAARQALARLGAADDATDSSRTDPEDTQDVTASLTGSTMSSSAEAVALVPEFDDDTIAASDRLILAVGDARLRYDTVSDAPSADGRASMELRRVRERPGLGYVLSTSASGVAAGVNYDGDDSSSRMFSIVGRSSIEARFYAPGRSIFAVTSAGLQLAADHLRINRPGPGNTTSESSLWADVELALGGGYGRVIDLGPRLRIRRLEEALRSRRLLGRTINDRLAERIFRAWWKLRDRQGYYHHLVATVALLREAGVLLSEPDAGTAYVLLQALADGQLDNRPSGLQLQLALGESFLLRDDDLGLEEGRIESVLARAAFGKQSVDARNEIVGEGFARYRILADTDEATPWAVVARVAYRRYRYGDFFDPMGALDVRGEAGVGKDGLMDSEVATHLAGSLGWMWIPTRANRLRLAGELRYESAEIFLGVTLEAQHGLLDVGFVGGE